jgi:predicted O-methyltransferase YrrM
MSLVGAVRSLEHVLTQQMRSWLGERLNGYRLYRVPQDNPDFNTLARADLLNLDDLLDPQPFEKEWLDVMHDVALQTGEHASLEHSANLGDQRALYQLVRRLRPRSVLEIGTLYGISALYIAFALWRNATDTKELGRLTTVDIHNVDDVRHPWIRSGLKQSPRAMIAGAGFANLVDFVTSDSSRFLGSTEYRFDFVYLDGSTAAAGAYRDLQALPRALQDGAVALVHVFFPGGQPLWSGERAITGMWRAVSRLQSEGTNIVARPLGELPWTTKRGTKKTSLALLGRSARDPKVSKVATLNGCTL